VGQFARRSSDDAVMQHLDNCTLLAATRLIVTQAPAYTSTLKRCAEQ
jgi:hypothetical protein